MAKHRTRSVSTAATTALDRAQIDYKMHCYTNEVAHEYGAEAATQLDMDAARIFKTLVVQVDHGNLAVGIVPVAGRLNLKALAAACGGKHATLAERSVAEHKTGYVIGGISPFGQRARLTQVLDASALNYETIMVSGGRRGVDVELSPADLLKVTGATTAHIAAPAN